MVRPARACPPAASVVGERLVPGRRRLPCRSLVRVTGVRGSPSHVIIILAYHPRTKEEYPSLYAANASNNSTKTSRNYLFGYLCYFGDEEEVSSHRVTTSSLVTSFSKLTSSKPRLKRIACMKVLLSAVKYLDRHRFDSEKVPPGFILAALRLHRQISDTDLAKSHIDGLAAAIRR